MGMPEGVPFMDRPDWVEAAFREAGAEYCPVTAAERLKRLSANERRSKMDEDDGLSETESQSGGGDNVKSKAGKEPMRCSALEMQFDLELHLMTGYMRRLDGEGLTRRNLKRMDPFAPDGEVKFNFDGSLTPYVGFWFYVAWYNVIVPVLHKTFGPILSVKDQDDLDELLDTTVAM
jgi:hypothetical protein